MEFKSVDFKKYIIFIMHYREIVFEIHDLQLELEEIELNISSLKITEKTSETYKINTPVEDSVLNFMDRKDDIERAIKFLEVKKKRAELLIESGFFTRQEQLYLMMKYIGDKQYSKSKEIAMDMGISPQSLRNLQARLERKIGFHI